MNNKNNNKKKKKIIISAATIVLSVAAIGSSFALYKIVPEERLFNLYVKSTSEVQYTISEPTADVGRLNPGPNGPGVDTDENNVPGSVVNDFVVGGEVHIASTYTQDIIHGDLIVEITLPNRNYAKALINGESHIMLDLNHDDEFSYMSDEDYQALHNEENPDYAATGRAAFQEYEYFDGGIEEVDENTFKIKAIMDLNPVFLSGTNARLIRSIALDGPEGLISNKEYIEEIAGVEPTEIKIIWEHGHNYPYRYVVGNMSDSNWTPVPKYQMFFDPLHVAFQAVYETTFEPGVKVGVDIIKEFVGGEPVFGRAGGEGEYITIQQHEAGFGRLILQSSTEPPMWSLNN